MSDEMRSQYDLFGWKVRLDFYSRPVNYSYAVWHRGVGDTRPEDTEAFDFERVISPGTSWEHCTGLLGLPWLEFQPYPHERPILIRRRLARFVRTSLRRDLGEVIRKVSELTAVEAGEPYYLHQQFHFDAFVGTLDAEKVLRLQVARGSTFALGYLESLKRDEEAAEGFRARFEALPDERRVIRMRRLSIEPGSDWLIKPLYFAIRMVPELSQWDTFTMACNLYMTYQAEPGGRIPVDGAWALGEEVHIARALVDDRIIPRSAPPNQHFMGLASLLYPEGGIRSLSVDRSAPVTSAWYKDRFFSPPAAVNAENMYHAEPLIKVVDGVRSRTHVTLTPQTLPGVSWQLGESSEGRYEPDRSGCWYCPPADPQPEYDQDGKTQKPCALKASLGELLTIDVLESRYYGRVFHSTFVIINAFPTHFFRVRNHNGRVSLRLYYIGIGGAQVEVDPQVIEWQVVAGDGRMAQDGTFTPGHSSTFSVVQAIEPDERQRYWYWAFIVIPVPLMDVDTFVAMSDSR
jgi:hypothetical protein